MLSLLAKIITTSDGLIKQESSAIIQSLAVCASGMEGCAAADQSEINILLKMTYSPSAMVREIALNVRGSLNIVLHGCSDCYVIPTLIIIHNRSWDCFRPSMPWLW